VILLIEKIYNNWVFEKRLQIITQEMVITIFENRLKRKNMKIKIKQSNFFKDQGQSKY
jgi:hypothetical protein